MPTVFCPMLSQETHIHFQFGPDFLEFTFSVDSSISKDHVLLKLIFSATEYATKT